MKIDTVCIQKALKDHASSKIVLKTFASRKITHTSFEVCILRHIING
jgi:hypothetical protein